MSDTVSVNVNNRGLSYAILDKVKAEVEGFNNFNATEWQSIFDELKANQVSTNALQFGDGDNDVTNNSHYNVAKNAGAYEIAQNVWNFILNKAKAKMEIVEKQLPQPQTQTQAQTVRLISVVDKNEEQQVVEQNNEEKIINDIKDILTKAHYRVPFEKMPKDLQENLIEKYKSIGLENNSENEFILKARLSNYIRGWQLNEFSTKALKDEESANYTLLTKFANNENKFDLYGQMDGESFIEYYDENNDGELNLEEMFQKEMRDYLLQTGSSKEEADVKSREIAEKYKGIKLSDIPRKNPDNDVEISLLQKLSTMYKHLNKDKKESLNSKEVGAYLLTMSSVDNVDFEISTTENQVTNMMLTTSKKENKEFFTRKERKQFFNILNMAQKTFGL